MFIKEFGKENNDIIMLLHGGGLSWWNYIDEITLLEKDFHVIIPILNGHSESDKDFISIEDNAKDIINFIKDNYKGKVKLIAGLSLGGQVLLEILSREEDICEYAILESVSVKPINLSKKAIKFIFGFSYGLIYKKWFAKMQFKYLKIQPKLFDMYFEDTKKITKKNFSSFMVASLRYVLKESVSNCKSKVIILYGGNENKSIKMSAEKISNKIKNSEKYILKDYYHGQLSINQGKEYVDIIKKIIGNSK